MIYYIGLQAVVYAERAGWGWSPFSFKTIEYIVKNDAEIDAS